MLTGQSSFESTGSSLSLLSGSSQCDAWSVFVDLQTHYSYPQKETPRQRWLHCLASKPANIWIRRELNNDIQLHTWPKLHDKGRRERCCWRAATRFILDVSRSLLARLAVTQISSSLHDRAPCRNALLNISVWSRWSHFILVHFLASLSNWKC